MRSLKHRWFAVAVLSALLSIAVHIYVPLRTIDTNQYFWLDHDEGLSLTTMGKWTHGASFGDGMSGEFSVLYQYASDWLINRISDLIGVPPFQTQFFYGAVLPGILLLSSFFFCNRLITHGGVAFLAALMVAYSSDPILIDPLYAYSGNSNILWIKAVFHVPAIAIALGTAQSVGWLLFIPALASVYLAVTRASFTFAVIGGLTLGLLFETSFLTFIGSVSAISMGLLVATLVKNYRAGEFAAFSARVVLLTVGIAIILTAANGTVTPLHIVLLWCLLFGLALQELKNMIFLFTSFVIAVATAFPLLFHFASNWSSLTRFANPVNVAMPLLITLIFFLPAWIAVAMLSLSLIAREKHDEIAYLLGATLSLVLLSKGELWGFINHQYRFAILLIFPLSILFAVVVLSIRKGVLKYLAIGLLAWMAISIGRNAAAIGGLLEPTVANPKYYSGKLGSFYYYVGVTASGPVTDAFLRTVALVTAEDKRHGSQRILLSPDDWNGNALILGVSKLPAFLPLPWFIVDTTSLFDRLRVFCFLFPEFLKSSLTHLEPGDCGVDGFHVFDHGHAVVKIHEPALKLNILKLFNIEVLADLNTAFGDLLRKYAHAYGLESVYFSDRAVIMKLPSLGMLPNLRSSGWRGGSWNISLAIENPGNYTVIVAGKHLGHRFTKIAVQDAARQRGQLYSDVFIGSAELEAGRHMLQLTACPGKFSGDPFPEPAPIHFIAVVPSKELEKYVSISTRTPPGDTNIGC
jgi:hypothetical protein